MKQLKVFSFLVMAFFAFSAQASIFGGYSTPEDAMKKDWRVVGTMAMAEAAGYNLNSSSIQNIYYIVPPTEPVYHSNTGVVVYNKRIGGDWSLETEYLTIDVEILYNQNTGLYMVGNITTETQIVH